MPQSDDTLGNTLDISFILGNQSHAKYFFFGSALRCVTKSYSNGLFEAVDTFSVPACILQITVSFKHAHNNCGKFLMLKKGSVALFQIPPSASAT